MPLSLWSEPLELDDCARADAPGQFVALRDGVTHYDLAGPETGPPVVLIHGYFTPYFTWEHTVDPLVEAGFRVLRYDLFGRGYSDRPKLVYDGDLFDRQLTDLLEALALPAPLHLVGFSMGGAIAVIFADRHPGQVRKMGLIAPAGVPRQRSWKEALVRVPLLRDILMRLHYRPSKYSERNRVQMQYKGFRRAIRSTIQHGPIHDLQAVYQRLGARRIPTILFWGRQDEVLPFAMSGRIRQMLPHLEFYAVDDAGHAAHHHQPEWVNPLLTAFLKNNGMPCACEIPSPGD